MPCNSRITNEGGISKVGNWDGAKELLCAAMESVVVVNHKEDMQFLKGYQYVNMESHKKNKGGNFQLYFYAIFLYLRRIQKGKKMQ